MSDLSNTPQSPAASSGEKEAEKSLIETSLSSAIALTKDNNLQSASDQFEAIVTQVSAESPTAAKLLRQLWQEYTSAQRSAFFWENMSDAEKDLSDKMTQNNVQLQRNYMRLVQEQ